MSAKRMKPLRDESSEEETDHESEREESACEGGGGGEENCKRKKSNNNDDDVRGGGGGRGTEGGKGDKIQGTSDDDEEEEGLVEIPDGKGIPLRNIPRIQENIDNTDCEHLIPLHKVLFNRIETNLISKRNIKKFHGFDFPEKSFQYFLKRGVLLGFKLRVLRNLCAFLDLKIAKEREDLVDNILNFLMNPRASGRTVKGQGRGRRWNMRGGQRCKAHRGKNRESSAEEESTDDNETEDEGDNDGDDENSEMRQNEETSIDESGQEDEGDDTNGEILQREEQMEEGKGGGSSKCSSKKSNSNVNEQRQERMRENKKRKVETCEEKGEGNAGNEKESEENEENEDKDKDNKGKGRGRNNSKKFERKRKISSEDGPPNKKTKKLPSNADIKKFLREYLEGADLDQTPMRIILQKLNEHYPGIDLSEKKDFIKENVVSLVRSIQERDVDSNWEKRN